MKAELNESNELVLTLSEVEALYALLGGLTELHEGEVPRGLVALATVAGEPFVQRENGYGEHPYRTEVDITDPVEVVTFAIGAMVRAAERADDEKHAEPDAIAVGNPYERVAASGAPRDL